MTHKLCPQRAVKTSDTATCDGPVRDFAFKQMILVDRAELWTRVEVARAH